jgi:hypothetical protein
MPPRLPGSVRRDSRGWQLPRGWVLGKEPSGVLLWHPPKPLLLRQPQAIDSVGWRLGTFHPPKGIGFGGLPDHRGEWQVHYFCPGFVDWISIIFSIGVS